jgi:signal transduction histidine kinase
MSDQRNPDQPPLGAPPIAEAFNAAQIGIAIVDAQLRIILMNPAFLESMGLPTDSIPPGTPVVDAVRAAALRGLYGPGDPEAQVRAIMAVDRTKPGRLRRRMFLGRSFDLFGAPMPSGGYVVSAIETTGLLAARAEAERTATLTRAALGTLRTGLAAFGPDRRLLFANPSFAQFISLPMAFTDAGTGFTDMLAALAERDEFSGGDGVAFLAEQLTINRALPNTKQRLTAAGTVIDVTSAPLPDGGWTITVTDVTALTRAEDEARRRARMLDTILANVPHGICVYGADHRVTLFNPTYSQVMVGAPVAVGEHMNDVINRRAEQGEFGEGEPLAIQRRESAHDITKPQQRRRVRPNGTAIDIRTAPLPDGGHMSVVTDITPLTQAQAEVARRATVMTSMVASIRHGILLWGPDHRLIATNQVTERLMGLAPGVLEPGRSDLEVLEIMRRDQAWSETVNSDKLAKELADRDHTIPYRRQVTMRDGRVLDMRSDPTPGGGWVTTYTDITDAAAIEDALRRSRDAAEAANLAKSRFLATMSHELRTPLNAIIGFSDALLREGAEPDPGRVTSFAQDINDAGRQLLSVINVVLDVARLESGRFDLSADDVEIAPMIAAVIAQSSIPAQAGEITVTTELADDLPRLRSDERWMRQALHQLLSNAIKFTEPGGRVTIGARVEPAGGLLIYIRDTGIGIPEADLDRVFEPFTQLEDPLIRRFPGAGLGLYIARTMINGHGGSLTLRSWPGGGTLAEARLPAERLRG